MAGFVLMLCVQHPHPYSFVRPFSPETDVSTISDLDLVAIRIVLYIVRVFTLHNECVCVRVELCYTFTLIAIWYLRFVTNFHYSDCSSSQCAPSLSLTTLFVFRRNRQWYVI